MSVASANSSRREVIVGCEANASPVAPDMINDMKLLRALLPPASSAESESAFSPALAVSTFCAASSAFSPS